MNNIKVEEKIEFIYSLHNENILDLIVNEENEKINKLIIIKHYNKKEYYVKEIKNEEFNKKSSYLVIFLCIENPTNSFTNLINKEVLHNSTSKNKNDSNSFIKNKIKKIEKKKNNIRDYNSYNKYEYENSRNKYPPLLRNSSCSSYFFKKSNEKNSEKIVSRNVFLLKKKMGKYLKNAYAKYIYKNKHIYFFIFNNENTHYIDRNLSIKKFLFFKSQLDTNSNITLCYKNKINNNLTQFFLIMNKIYKVKKISYSNDDTQITKKKSLELSYFSKEKKKRFLNPIFTNRFISNNNSKFIRKCDIKRKDNFPYNNKKNIKYLNRSFISYHNSFYNNKGIYDIRCRTFPYLYVNEKNKIKKNFEANKLKYFKDHNFYKYNVIRENNTAKEKKKKKNYNDLVNDSKEKKKNVSYKKNLKNKNKITNLNVLNSTKSSAVLRSYPKKKKINRINNIFLKKENKIHNNYFVENLGKFCNLNKHLYKKKSFPFSKHDNYIHKNYFDSSYFSTQRNLSYDFYQKKKNYIYEKKNENVTRKNSMNEYITKLYPKRGVSIYCNKYKRKKIHNKKFEKYKYSENDMRNLNKVYSNSFNRRKNYFFNSDNFEKFPKFQRIKNKDNKKYFCTDNARNITVQAKRKSYFDKYNSCNNNRNFFIKKKIFDYENDYKKLPSKYNYNLKKKKIYFSFHNFRNLNELNCSNMRKYNSNNGILPKNYQIRLEKEKNFNKMDCNSLNAINSIDKNRKCSMSELKAFKTKKENVQNYFKDISSSLEYDSFTINDEKGFKKDMNFSLNLKNLQNKTDFEVELKKINISKDGQAKYNCTNTRKEKLEFAGNQCDKIFQNKIFVSGYKFLSNKLNIEEKGITHIINAAGYECVNKYENMFMYRTYYLKDDMHDDIFYTLLDSLYFIKNALKENEKNKILIHCNKGISRSIIIIIFFLMNELNLNYFDAFQIVKNSRTLSNPNMNYITQLLNLYNIKKTVQNINKGQENQLIKDKTINKNIINKDNNTLLSNNFQIYNEQNKDNNKNYNDIICLFRIDLEGNYLSLRKLDNLVHHDSDNDSTTLIDKRFNYIIAINFKDYYLILFDDAYESIFHSIFNHFVHISSDFFGNVNKTCIIRSHFMNFFENLKIKIKIMNSITDCDKLFLNIQNFLKRS
ncbi:protein tyrosine phosphatase, putative [Plasmodium relictum]|uniref:Protein tyrosine phosphatase, putative n=1 Tax=Plasmodium relictum TaxID=85471 RepID=A0A1J1H0G9_PLARL|nr:protein tyrosine phosphatase, putative [Plasmodium relictum]CRG98463.1 protein tyrosine phosphatase, putative [Plasmodium relictum]